MKNMDMAGFVMDRMIGGEGEYANQYGDDTSCNGMEKLSIKRDNLIKKIGDNEIEILLRFICICNAVTVDRCRNTLLLSDSVAVRSRPAACSSAPRLSCIVRGCSRP